MILDEIVCKRREDYAGKTHLRKEYESRLADRCDFRPFHAALKRRLSESPESKSTESERIAIIAEIKRASPAKGLFAPDINPAVVASEYEQGGAACLSVLTEPRYFHGSLDDLIIARKHCRLPVLRKEFVVSEVQVVETALYADAVLLIARSLEAKQLSDYFELAVQCRLDVLVELFDENDFDKIAAMNFPLVGINNRNLQNMEIDIRRSGSLWSRCQPNQDVVAASGVTSRNDIEMMMRSGIRIFLIGETLSRHPNRIEHLKMLLGGR